MLNQIIAHAGENHDSAVEATAHEMAWYIQLLVFLVATLVFASLVYFLTKQKKDTTLLLTSLALLISGFGLFRVAPIASATAITIGLFTTLGITLLGLGSDKKPKK